MFLSYLPRVPLLGHNRYPADNWFQSIHISAPPKYVLC